MIKYRIAQRAAEYLKLRDPKNHKELLEYAQSKVDELNKKQCGTTGKVNAGNYTLDLEVESYDEEDVKELKDILGDTYHKIIEILKEYIDLREEHYIIIAIWIIGTYFHDNFPAYPYLFLNAMRGSGKTRLLKLISSLSNQGKVLLSPTEAVMFRIPKGNTLCIDELEGLGRKENAGLREMLNACYKKGSTVTRMKQKRTQEGTEQIIEEFEPYKPICMANIWGMEEVLGDRCIPIILEKSSRKDVMRLMEDFDSKVSIKSLKAAFCESLVYMCSFIDVTGGIYKWNIWVKQVYTTPHTPNTITTHTTQTTLQEKDIKLFEKIDGAGIIGRNLELFFPLMLIGDFLGEEVLDKIIFVAKTLNDEKRKEEMIESKDVSLMDYISKIHDPYNYKQIKVITDGFRAFLGNVEDFEEKWINERWVGRALKRLNLIVEKRRVRSGVEVTLNQAKAKEKMGAFD